MVAVALDHLCLGIFDKRLFAVNCEGDLIGFWLTLKESCELFLTLYFERQSALQAERIILQKTRESHILYAS